MAGKSFFKFTLVFGPEILHASQGTSRTKPLPVSQCHSWTKGKENKPTPAHKLSLEASTMCRPPLDEEQRNKPLPVSQCHSWTRKEENRATPANKPWEPAPCMGYHWTRNSQTQAFPHESVPFRDWGRENKDTPASEPSL